MLKPLSRILREDFWKFKDKNCEERPSIEFKINDENDIPSDNMEDGKIIKSDIVEK
jgi:hypothetical protein